MYFRAEDFPIDKWLILWAALFHCLFIEDVEAITYDYARNTIVFILPEGSLSIHAPIIDSVFLLKANILLDGGLLCPTFLNENKVILGITPRPLSFFPSLQKKRDRVKEKGLGMMRKLTE